MKVSSNIATQTQYYKYEEIIKMASTCNYTFYLKEIPRDRKMKDFECSRYQGEAQISHLAIT